MNSHKKSDEVFDLSLNHTLKNWVDRKSSPKRGREQLLGMAVQQDVLPARPKALHLNIGWSFRFQTSLEALSSQPVYGFSMESAYSLRANMAIV